MEVGVLVRVLRVPEGMTAGDVLEEIRRSLEFGRPELQLLYILPGAEDDEPAGHQPVAAQDAAQDGRAGPIRREGAQLPPL
jgi:hypothetical protein